jgi:hypothetical protein
MRITTLLLATLLIATSTFAQAPTTQPAAQPAPVAKTTLAYPQAIDTLNLPADKKSAALEAFKTRDAGIQTWYETNKDELQSLRDALKRARETKDAPALDQATKRITQLDTQQEAMRTQLRTSLAQLLTPDHLKTLDALMRTSPPPMDGSKIKTIQIVFENPQFTPQITSATFAALLDLAKPLRDSKTTHADRETAIDQALRKILTLFPDPQKLDLIGRWTGGSSDPSAPSLQLSQEQVLDITKIVAKLQPDPHPDPISTEKTLRLALDTLSFPQRRDIVYTTLTGIPYYDKNNPPLQPAPAIEVLCLAPEQKAQALKIIQDFTAASIPVLAKANAELESITNAQAKAAHDHDRSAVLLAQKQSKQVTDQYKAYHATLAGNLKDLLTPSDYQRYITLTTTSPAPGAAILASPTPGLTPAPSRQKLLSPAQALDTLNLSSDKKAAALQTHQQHREKLQNWYKDNAPETLALREKLDKAKKENDTPTIQEIHARFAQLSSQESAFMADYSAAMARILTPDEWKTFTTLTRPAPPRPPATQSATPPAP